jgi:hypothetical protein
MLLLKRYFHKSKNLRAAVRPARGAALFMILIAVALFAMLSYAVTQSGRSTGAAAGPERAEIYAAQIVDMGNTLKQDVARLILSGVPATGIKIGTGSWFTGQTNDYCTSGVTCLFAGTGYAAAVPRAPAGAMTDGVAHNVYFDTHSQNLGAPLTAYWNVGTGANDEAVRMDSVRKDVCLAINRSVGINSIPYWVSGASWTGITGSVDAACVDWGGAGALSGQYTFYQVLIAN